MKICYDQPLALYYKKLHQEINIDLKSNENTLMLPCKGIALAYLFDIIIY